MGAEADIHTEHVPQLSTVDILLDQVDPVVEAIYHPDIQHFPGFMLYTFCISSASA